jgi:cyclic pyranopterin phosphate synthase
MGDGAPTLDAFFAAAAGLKVRATCVMARESVEDAEGVWHYIDALRPFGVTEFTFKHTYVAYEGSLFRSSEQNEWARGHKVEFDPFGDEGEVVAELPWGPRIRRIRGVQACYYHEPTPQWERANRVCRSSNLLSDGSVFASLEDTSSLLFRLPRSPRP